MKYFIYFALFIMLFVIEQDLYNEWVTHWEPSDTLENTLSLFG